MEFCYRNKFNHCPHARQALMHAKAELVEGTLNKKWGSGLDVVWTKECHLDYWPSQNVMGQILMKIWQGLESDWNSHVEEDEWKRKLTSPGDENSSKKLQ